ncbi:hypothetical protein EGT74_18035 [Chitinophaga lutea]|uniref:Bacterial Pleckstrin homology domain-containing protein n=1 Tax=Chitinophaga lutea TaxID=2488634 RepID=A0A3N4PMU2_9BACT|nr:PH domain-containing protein [Chitinophaga lutea]RPE08918.1 hypothetical protein EGT74_18035 [Chitinophaga lutea]
MSYPIYTDTSCKVITAAFSIITLALAVMPFIDPSAPWGIYLAVTLLLLVYLISYLLRPNSYTIDENKLAIQSAMSRKEYAIENIGSVHLLPKHALHNSYRALGIGGLFSYRGTINIKNWGNVMSYARGFKDNIIILTLKSGERLLLSPEDESSFYQAISQKIAV